jgi:hypothetical protein
MLGLAMKSLPSSDEHGYYKNFYECGAVMNHLLERKFLPNVTLFDFWRSLFQSAGRAFYTQDSFFKIAQPMLTDANAVSAISDIARGSTGEPSHFFKSTFDQLGISYSSVTSEFPRWYQDQASKNVVALLTQRDCGESIAVDVADTGIYVQGSERCTSLKTEHELRSINGYAVPLSGAEAHDYLFNQCKENPIAAIYDSAGQGFVTTCHDFPQRPEYLIW